MRLTSTWVARAILACALSLAAGGTRAQTSFHATDPSGSIVLRDASGNAIPVGSNTFYSPERTCGDCHDVAKITEGYHFQQGKGFSNSSIYVSDNYNPVKTWLLSDGMYGKW